MSKKFSTSWGVKLLWIRIEISLGINSSFINAKGKETEKLKNWKTKVQLISLTYQLATTFKHVTFIHMPYDDCLTKCNWSRFTKLPKSQYELKRLKLCVSFQQSQPEQIKGSRHSKKVKIKKGETDGLNIHKATLM